MVRKSTAQVHPLENILHLSSLISYRIYEDQRLNMGSDIGQRKARRMVCPTSHSVHLLLWPLRDLLTLHY